LIEEILPNLYKLDIPLPGSPLKAVNSYIIKGKDRNLIVDTGLDQEECMAAMQYGLRKLGVDLMKTDFFITHLHVDHFGLAKNLVTDESVVYFNRPDAEVVSSDKVWREVLKFTHISGFPVKELEEALEERPGYKRSEKGDLEFTILKEGDIIEIGDYVFTCIETPGHSRGHMCLYESDKKILLSGDHVLKDISPNISLWTDEINPLKDFLKSLDKIYEFDVDLVLPGHRSVFTDCRERIRELKRHHLERANEVMTILDEGCKDACQVAAQMHWDLHDSWDLFPVTQKWFAAGEAIAHLKYLEGKQVVRKEIKDEKIVYLLA
jgi:glyoxylase-like metal-dependent hydrolase (beta-lactamase superfamily II)